MVTPFTNYRSYLTQEQLLSHGYKPEIFSTEPNNRWFTPGWGEPIYVSHSTSGGISNIFLGLFRLFAATNIAYF